MVVHLNSHSHYSFLEGIPSPAELVEKAAQSGMSALALTDTNGLTGAVEFQDLCNLNQIQAILGMECWVSPLEMSQTIQGIEINPPRSPHTAIPPSERLVLLAENQEGWSNLSWLSSHLHSDPSNSIKPIQLDDLESYSEGLVCLAAGANSRTAGQLQQTSLVEENLSTLSQIFTKSLYLNLQIHRPEDIHQVNLLAKMGRRLNIPLVASHGIYYLNKEETELQQLVSAIRLNCTIPEIPEHELAKPSAYFLSQAEMAQRFQSYPQALRNTSLIAERCHYQLPSGQTHFPTPSLPPGEDANSMLRKKAFAGARERYGNLTHEINARLEHELSIIQQYGYAALFLIVADIIEFARHQGIPISSRGSAASSLVAYSLRITSPDPLQLNLYFERFLNPARATPPDIDTDICSKRRDEVLNYTMQKFGLDRVAMVATINCFRERSALRETVKAYGLPSDQIRELTERLPHRWFGESTSAETQPLEALKQSVTHEKHKQIIDRASQILRKPHHLSIHPGGVVITPGKMTEFVPTFLAPKGLVTTQFDHFQIERLGLVKIDLLGIRGLSVLGDVEACLRSQTRWNAERQPVHHNQTQPQNLIPWPTFYNEKEMDPQVEAILQEGRTIGCFQIESPGMRSTLREINARRLEDIMVALALYRPGPLTGGLKQIFVERYRSHQRGIEQPFEHLHPSLAPLLGDTYGVILYQEQVLRVAHELAGLTLAEADLLRRAMSHFDPGKQMQTLKEKFLSGVFQRHQIPVETAERIWELMSAFAGYGFPKAHAASYAQIAWRAAWSKVHHPAIFMAAVLANWGGYYSQRVYLNEARRMGLTLRAPHINYAQPEFSVQYLNQEPILFMGLNQVRELTRNTVNNILTGRPFHSLSDFLVRVDPKTQEIENLIRVGALEGLGEIPGLLQQVKRQDWKNGQFPLFDFNQTAGSEPWSMGQIIADQETILGAAVIGHPLELAAEKIQAAGAHSTVEALQYPGQTIRIAGMRQTWRRGKNSRGEIFYRMALEDLEGMLDVFISGEVYRRFRHAFSKPGPWIIEGVIEPNPSSAEYTFRASRFELLD